MDNRRLLLAAVLSMVIVVGWQYLFPPPEPVQPTPVASPASVPPEPGTPPVVAAEVASVAGETPTSGEVVAAVEAVAEERVLLENDEVRAEFSNRGGELVSFRLKRLTDGDKPIELVRARSEGVAPLGLVDGEGRGLPWSTALHRVSSDADEQGRPSLTFEYSGPLGQVRKSVALTPKGSLLVSAESNTPGVWGLLLGPGVREMTPAELASRYSLRFGVYSDGASIETLAVGKAFETKTVPGVGLAWAGIEDTYFLSAFIPHQELDRVMFLPRLQVPTAEGARFDPVPAENMTKEQKALPRDYAVVAVARAGKLSGEVFLGGKDYDVLQSYGVGLERSVRLGWFGWFAKIFLRSLQWIHGNVVANYGWAIVLLTVLIRVVLLPLTHQSMVSAQKMQELNPKVQSIRQKYSGKLRDKKGGVNFENQRKMSEEINALYKTAGVNPLGGCLPMLIQLPVLVAFYNLLANAIELRGAPWIGWIHDLSVYDPYYVLPIVMGAAQFAQQALAPPMGDPTQRKIFMVLPVVFTVMFASAPSGLVLYWLVNNLLSLAQQSFYKRWNAGRASAAAA